MFICMFIYIFSDVFAVLDSVVVLEQKEFVNADKTTRKTDFLEVQLVDKSSPEKGIFNYLMTVDCICCC